MYIFAGRIVWRRAGKKERARESEREQARGLLASLYIEIQPMSFSILSLTPSFSVVSD
jgi:hypothetical protein